MLLPKNAATLRMLPVGRKGSSLAEVIGKTTASEFVQVSPWFACLKLKFPRWCNPVGHHKGGALKSEEHVYFPGFSKMQLLLVSGCTSNLNCTVTFILALFSQARGLKLESRQRALLHWPARARQAPELPSCRPECRYSSILLTNSEDFTAKCILRQTTIVIHI